MGLETGDFIDDLVATNPVTASDPVTEGSNHIRLLKKVVQQSFGLMDGLLQFPTNDTYFKQSNFAGNGFVNMFKVNASDQVEVGAALIVNNSLSVINATSAHAYLQAGVTSLASLNFGDSEDPNVGFIQYSNTTNEFSFRVGAASSQLTLSTSEFKVNTGNLIVSAGDLIVSAGDLTVSAGYITVKGDVSSPGADSGVLGVSASAGVQLAGNGTVTDLILLNKSGSFIMKTPTGTVNAEFGGDLTLSTGHVNTGGIVITTSGAPSYVAGVLGWTDLSSWGFKHRPPIAGDTAAHSFEAFDGTDLLNIAEDGDATFSGNIIMNAGKKLALSLDENTYWVEPSSNVIQGVTSGVARISISSSGLSVFTGNIILDAGDITVTDGVVSIRSASATGNPYLAFAQGATDRGYVQFADAGDKMTMRNVGSNVFSWAGVGGDVLASDASGNISVPIGNLTVTAGDLKLASTNKLYLDGGTDTYINEGIANRIDFIAAASGVFVMNNSGVNQSNLPLVVLSGDLTVNAGNLSVSGDITAFAV